MCSFFSLVLKWNRRCDHFDIFHFLSLWAESKYKLFIIWKRSTSECVHGLRSERSTKINKINMNSRAWCTHNILWSCSIDTIIIIIETNSDEREHNIFLEWWTIKFLKYSTEWKFQVFSFSMRDRPRTWRSSHTLCGGPLLSISTTTATTTPENELRTFSLETSTNYRTIVVTQKRNFNRETKNTSWKRRMKVSSTRSLEQA